jgi:hypothetical protein
MELELLSLKFYSKEERHLVVKAETLKDLKDLEDEAENLKK